MARESSVRFERFSRRTEELPGSAEDLYAWHARPGAFQRLNPPWERVEVLSHSSGIEDGAKVELLTRLGPIRNTWHLIHEDHTPGRRFCDRQTKGPFAYWRHEHSFEDGERGTCVLDDRICYRLPFGIIGRILGGYLVRLKLRRVFSYRHETTRLDMTTLNERKSQAPMKIIISGGTGLVGNAMAPFLSTQGHDVSILTRHPEKTVDGAKMIAWDPLKQELDPKSLDGVDAVIHLAGANIAEGRWTAARKREILDSRVLTTRLLVDTFAKRRGSGPFVFVCSSATGYYGDTGDTYADENSPLGTGFLADVCRRWEAEARKAEDLGIRTVILRTGVVISPKGGALAKLLPPFRAGLGGPVGSGRQWVSWIAIDDLLKVFTHVISNKQVMGPVNAVSPHAVRNKGLAAALGKVLRRPAAIPVPAIALKMAFGEMARETVLASCRAAPKRLEESGFSFAYPDIEGALRRVLGR